MSSRDYSKVPLPTIGQQGQDNRVPNIGVQGQDKPTLRRQFDEKDSYYSKPVDLTPTEKKFLNNRGSILQVLEIATVAIKSEMDKNGLETLHPLLILAYGRINELMSTALKEVNNADV